MPGRILFIFFVCFAIAKAKARDCIEIESSRQDGGWFKYSVRTLPDPFIKNLKINVVHTTPFTSLTETVIPDHWTNIVNGDWPGLGFDDSYTQPRTNDTSFFFRTGLPGYRTVERGVLVLFYFEFTAPYTRIDGGGGYVWLPAIIPCTAEESDNSPTNRISRFELVQDITIESLVHTNNQVFGLRYRWAEPSTVDLEASHDLADWNFITRIYGDPPVTTWTTNKSLDHYGKFYRLSLVSNSHSTGARADIPIDNGSVAIKSLGLKDQKLDLQFLSEPRQTYEVTLRDRVGSLVERQRVTATNTITAVSFERDTLLGLFDVRKVLLH